MWISTGTGSAATGGPASRTPAGIRTYHPDMNPQRSRAAALLKVSPVAIALGVVCALVLTAVDWTAEKVQHFAWTWLPDRFGAAPDGAWWIVAVLACTGVAVGLIVWLWPWGAGPEPATADLVEPPLPVSAVPGVLACGVIALAGGVSLGPENPVTAANIALLAAFGARLMPKAPGGLWLGVGAAGTVGALFGTPVAAALMLSETQTGERDTPLWDQLFAPLLAAGSASLTMQLLGQESLAGGLPYPGTRWWDLVSGPVIALVAAALGVAASIAFGWSYRAFALLRHPLAKTVVAGLVLGGLGVLGGTITLFKGLDETKRLLGDPAAYTVGGLVLLVVVKLAALVVAGTSGFRGGRIFPVVFAASALGLLAVRLAGGVPVGLSVGAAVLGLTLAVTRHGWLSLFLAVTLVGQVTVLPVLCLAILPAWLLVSVSPPMVVRAENA